jgi:NAD(P)H-flavin reductase
VHGEGAKIATGGGAGAPKRRLGPASGGGFPIVSRQNFSDTTFLLEIDHPVLARAARPGQFVADYDRDEGSVTLVVQAVGKSTREMQFLCRPGAALYGMVGPMGQPSRVGGAKKVVCVGGGLGVAPIFPQARAFKEKGAYVIGVVGFRNRSLIFWENKFRQCSDELIICTDDGSAGIHGLVTKGIEQAIEQHPDIDEVAAIGPPIMMKACVETTRAHGIKTVVSLNPIMVDGTGMCGGCRVKVGGRMMFACVDGPDFDGHSVDFEDLMNRQRRFKEEEQLALDRWMESCRRLDMEPDTAATRTGGKS